MELAEVRATMGPRALASLESPSLRVSIPAERVTPATAAIHTNLREGMPLKPLPVPLNTPAAATPTNPMVIQRTNGAVIGVSGSFPLHSTRPPSRELVMP